MSNVYVFVRQRARMNSNILSSFDINTNNFNAHGYVLEFHSKDVLNSSEFLLLLLLLRVICNWKFACFWHLFVVKLSLNRDVYAELFRQYQQENY